MAYSVIMPKTGMAMEEGMLIEWKVKPGDQVHKGDVVAEIETDKSTMELEADYDGVVLAVLANPGQIVPVTQVIAWIGAPGETPPAVAAASSAAAPVKAPEPATQGASFPGTAPQVSAEGRVKATPAARKAAKDQGIPLESAVPSGKAGEIRLHDVEHAAVNATPLARRMAEAQGIPLEGIQGSGHGGKVFSSDLSARVSREIPGTLAAPPSAQDQRVPLTMKQIITGRRMSESRQTIPEVTQHTRADVTQLLAIRQELNDKLSSHITINDFVLAATMKALVAYPRMNATLDNKDVIYRGSVNLGMAAATDRGLVVPVIFDAQNLTLRQLSAKAAELAARAREGRLATEEMTGGTFTVSNVGMYGVTGFTPIINPPEAGILGVCVVEEELKLENGQVVARKVMGLSHAYDHRVVDGAEAATFFKILKDLLESPLLILA
jgi:pyruvate dehydrogenase E2 component (dihydrolipoamide acetyltransferase)